MGSTTGSYSIVVEKKAAALEAARHYNARAALQIVGFTHATTDIIHETIQGGSSITSIWYCISSTT